MNELAIIGLIVVAALAVIGLGIKVAIKIRTGNSFKNISAGGDVVGRDKN